MMHGADTSLPQHPTGAPPLTLAPLPTSAVAASSRNGGSKLPLPPGEIKWPLGDLSRFSAKGGDLFRALVDDTPAPVGKTRLLNNNLVIVQDVELVKKVLTADDSVLVRELGGGWPHGCLLGGGGVQAGC